MQPKRFHSLGLTLALAGAAGASAQPVERAEESPIELVLAAGRPLRVALDQRIRLHAAGQPVTGTVVEDVYCYDRVVVPAGTKVLGRVERFERMPTRSRLRAILSGNLTTPRLVVLQFDRLVLDDQELPIQTHVSGGIENVSLLVAPARDKTGRAQDVRQAGAPGAARETARLPRPGAIERLKDAVIGSLPWHPHYLRKGTVYTAELVAPLDLGTATPTERAAAGEPLPAESVLNARLLEALDSAKAARGTPIRAVLTRPVFNADQKLILAEGVELQGEVTFAQPARRLHRNGQLRFLFETVRLPGEDDEAMKASLHAAELDRGQRVAIDEEGGMKVSNSNARFVVPALALVSFRSSLAAELPTPGEIAGSGTGLMAELGGGLVGAVLSETSRPGALGLGILYFVRTAYGAVFGKGREVVIPADTPIRLDLAPRRSRDENRQEE